MTTAELLRRVLWDKARVMGALRAQMAEELRVELDFIFRWGVEEPFGGWARCSCGSLLPKPGTRGPTTKHAWRCPIAIATCARRMNP